MSSARPRRQTHPQIFLWYDNADRAKASELKKHLEGDGFSAWMDQTSLPPSENWELRIRTAIEDADAVIICLSRVSTSRPGYLKSELDVVMKVAEPKPPNIIIPVRLEDCPVPALLELFQYVDLFVEDGYERLLSALHSLGLETKEADPAAANTETSAVGSGSAAPLDTANQTSNSATAETQTKDQNKTNPYPGNVVRRGSSGDAVTKVQRRLKELGFNVEADGVFGRSTEKAVLDFQTSENLPLKDGIVGPRTWAALLAEPVIGGDPESTDVEPTLSVKEGLAEEARERNALNDKPMDDVEKDTLGFRDYVYALRDFIGSQSTTTPLTISVNGAWGSGKSSLMRMLQRQLEPAPAGRLWWIQLKWVAGWLRGTVISTIGSALIRAKHRDAFYIRLGFAFAPDDDVTAATFDTLFEKFIEYSLKQDHLRTIEPFPGDSVEEERKRRREKTRFWARESARRRKMKPRSHPTVWFNAWKFNQQEQVWAALAMAVLGQLESKYSRLNRLRFLTKLTLRRTDKLATITHIVRKLIVPIAIAVIVALYQVAREKLPPYLRLPTQGWKEQLVWLAPVLAAAWQAIKAIENPFQLPIDELITQPDYQGKIGFIGTFEEDFGRIVDVAIRRSIFWQPRKLIIFIDDLDRCSPIQAAGIVEAINLFLDSVGCVFVLGMDMNAVAISIEVKYKELSERMRKESPDSVSPGVLFLDKIVQIPLNVPRPNKEAIESLVRDITKPQSRELPSGVAAFRRETTSQAGAKSSGAQIPAVAAQTTKPPTAAARPVTPETKIDRASFARDDIREAIEFAAQLLKENPRQVKRFINLFRLQVYIAHERGMLSDNEFGLTPRQLAVWVVSYMQWPEIFRLLASSAQDQELYWHLADLSARVVAPAPEDGVHWRLDNGGKYLTLLKTVRENDGGITSHWSNLPWPLWIRDSDFLHCVKELERYWNQPERLGSMLDMTRVTVSQKPAAAELTATPIPNDTSRTLA